LSDHGLRTILGATDEQIQEEAGMSAIDTYLGNNAKYADGFSKGSLPIPPAGEIAIVACMDARLDVGALLGLEVGDAHVIRNAGGVVTDDVIRSLAISQRLLGTREIMLIHHTDCGMLKFEDAELKDAIQNETGIRPPFAIETFSDLDGDVRQSIARINASPFVVHQDAVRGFVYEVETGRLREVK
jgi:carbonic anhydrase